MLQLKSEKLIAESHKNNRTIVKYEYNISYLMSANNNTRNDLLAF